MAWDFITGIIELENLGLSDVLLPFLLIFSVVYAILEKTNLLRLKAERSSSSVNIIVALVMALLPVVFHVTGSYPDYDVIEVINNSLSTIGLLMVAFFMLIFAIGASGLSVDFSGVEITGLTIGLGILFIINFAVKGIPFWVFLLSLFIILIYIISSKGGASKNSVSNILFFIVFSIVAYVFGHNMGYFQEAPEWFSDPGAKLILIILAIIIIGTGFLTGGNKKS